jgi:hypothetical protein
LDLDRTALAAFDLVRRSHPVLSKEVHAMKRSLSFVLFLGLLAVGAFAAMPTSARSGAPASDLQLSVTGREAVAAGNPGCTRITNRFCAESTRSNCSACH